MKLIISLLFFSLLLSCNNKNEKELEYDHIIKTADLVRMVEEGHSKDIPQFLKKTRFYITRIDSSTKSLTYNCNDSLDRNSFFIIIGNDSLVNTLSLSTEDKRLNDRIEKDLKKDGFYLNEDPFIAKLVKKGSSAEISMWIGEGMEHGVQKTDYQILINKREEGQ